MHNAGLSDVGRVLVSCVYMYVCDCVPLCIQYDFYNAGKRKSMLSLCTHSPLTPAALYSLASDIMLFFVDICRELFNKC